MKKSLNKVIVTLAAVTALTAAMAVTASAAIDAKQEPTTDGKTKITATVTGKKAGEQVTMLVLKPTANAKDGISEDEIAYIDQKAATVDDKGNVTAVFEMPIGKTTAGEKYELLSGSTSATEKADQGEVVIPSAGEKTHYGDVTGDDKIMVNDAVKVLDYIAENIELTDAEKLCADVTKDSKIMVNDAVEILKYIAEEDVSFDTSWMKK